MSNLLIDNKFNHLKQNKQCGFIAYICAGHPNYQISQDILAELPLAGVDFIEVGVPFLDPAGDGPIIENAAKTAIRNGMNLQKTLEMIANFRLNAKNNNCHKSQQIPIILMTYYNPILAFGIDKFFIDAEKAGVNGVLIVDLSIEEQNEIADAVSSSNISVINLIAPITNQERILKIAKKTSGFLYIISMLGITGTKTANLFDNKARIEKINEQINSQSIKLPLALGFGIKTPDQAGDFVKTGADALIIGSAIVEFIDNQYKEILKNNDEIDEKDTKILVSAAVNFITEFANKIHNQ